LGGTTDSTGVLVVTRGEDCWIVPGSTLRAGDREGGFEVIDLEILFLVSPPRDPVLLMVDFDTWSPVAPSLEDPFTGVGRSLASPDLLLCATSISVSKLVQVTDVKRHGAAFPLTASGTNWDCLGSESRPSRERGYFLSPCHHQASFRTWKKEEKNTCDSRSEDAATLGNTIVDSTWVDCC
jgi:hypothetical protein